jgi:hypothetical protein
MPVRFHTKKTTAHLKRTIRKCQYSEASVATFGKTLTGIYGFFLYRLIHESLFCAASNTEIKMQAPQSITSIAPQPVSVPLEVHWKRDDANPISLDPITERNRVFAEAVKLRDDSHRLIEESRALSAQSQTLKQWWRRYRQNRERTPSRTAVAKPLPLSEKPVLAEKFERPTMATARRVPWHRLQMEDIDGEVIEWTAPEYAAVFS